MTSGTRRASASVLGGKFRLGVPALRDNLFHLGSSPQPVRIGPRRCRVSAGRFDYESGVGRIGFAGIFSPVDPSGSVSCERVERDSFICHASEDKDGVARPLALELEQRGLSVWYDETVLRMGDSLRREIDKGLSHCLFGVVVLSPSFFAKEWPQRELDGLTQRETAAGRKVILPVWHEVNSAQVAIYSPVLADRVGVSTSRGIPHVAEQIFRVFEPSDLSLDLLMRVRPVTLEPAPPASAIPPGGDDLRSLHRPGPSPGTRPLPVLRVQFALPLRRCGVAASLPAS
jgi:hypothetical protein